MRTSERRRPASPFRYSPLIAAFACAFGGNAVAMTYTVSTANSTGTGSLEQAILDLNSHCAGTPDPSYVINFSGGPFTISPSSPLPAVVCTSPVDIQATGQVLDGSNVFLFDACGLTGGSPLTQVTGMEVRNFAYGGSGYGFCGSLTADGVKAHGNTKGFYLTGDSFVTGSRVYGNSYGIYSTANLTVESSLIGTPDGVIAGPNDYGIYYSGVGTANVLLQNNVISGNTFSGVQVYDAATVSVVNNRIGTDTSGTAPLPNQYGLEIYSYFFPSVTDNATVSGNVISGNTWTGAILYNVAAVSINGNKIGTNAAGTAALPNQYGLDVDYTYGGSIDNNVISANTYGGLSLYNTDLSVTLNKIGTDEAGASALGNGQVGLQMDYAIGGTVGNNVISGNATGVSMYNASGVVLSGNRIGTNATGTAGIANAFSGIDASCSSSLQILGNVVSTNGAYGGLYLQEVAGSLVQGNLIGTAADGVSPLSNAGPGIRLDVDPFCNQLFMSATDLAPKVATLGGLNSIVDNTIAHNQGDGILVVGADNWGNTIGGTSTAQSIHSNNGKNINLDYSLGPLPNDTDPPDGSGGPNNRQNHPLISSAVEDSGNTHVSLTLNSLALGAVLADTAAFNGQFTIDVYGNAQAGVPAGQKWLKQATLFTDAAGNGGASLVIPGTGYGHITATATGPYGTSEFSNTLTALVPSASISPTNVAFGNVIVGATVTSPTAIEFRSNGTGDYVIDSITEGATAPTCPGTPVPPPFCASGDFSCSVSCTVGALYPPLAAPTDPASCTVTGLSFHPLAAGAQTKTLWICDNAGTTPRAITLTGTGVPHVVTASQSSHDFGDVSVGTQVDSPAIVITNAAGNPPATLGSPTVAAPFSIASNSCTSTLEPGATCSLSARYVPTAVGASSDTLTMSVANGNPISIALTGNAVASPLGQLLLPAGVDLGSAVLASAPLLTPVQMKNTGNAPVTFGSIVASSPFTLSHDCPASLAPAATCTATVGFDPLIYGTTTGQLIVTSDASGSPHVATLLATVSSVPYGISPTSSDYGSIPVGSSSTPRAFIISNNGENAIPLSGVSVSGPFTLASNTCGTSLGPQSSCTAEVAFAPVQPGMAEGALTAQVGLSGAPPATSLLSGTGTQAPALALPGAIDFGALVLGTPSASQSVEIRNTGNAVLTFSTSVSGPFALSGDCGLNLLPSAACNLVISFTPSAVGEFTGSLAVVSNAPGGSGSIPITARVQPVARPDIRLDVTSVGFGDRMIGTPSASQRVTVTNVGGVMALLGITPPTRDFIATSQCGATLAPGASCTTDVVFLPLAVGPRFNRLQFTSDAPGSPFAVDLIGRGCSPARRGRPPSCN